jgi:hypothetical protein
VPTVDESLDIKTETLEMKMEMQKKRRRRNDRNAEVSFLSNCSLDKKETSALRGYRMREGIEHEIGIL